jgi:hypothetical protein
VEAASTLSQAAGLPAPGERDKGMDIVQAAYELYPLLNHDDGRMIGMITEEAGEVSGAYNKWIDDRKDKPKTVNDIIDETVQWNLICTVG